MEKYVLQLLQDIELIILARWNDCPPHFYQGGIPDKYLIPPSGWKKEDVSHGIDIDSSEQFDLSIHEMENWLEGNSEFSMFYHFNLKPMQFPPADRLTDEQIDKITFVLLRLWASFNFTATIPENAPGRLIYPILLKEMHNPTTVMDFGSIGVEFCDYEPKNCPFGTKYCSCINYR